MGWTDRLRALRVDVTPLRESRDFRLLFLAGTVFYLGGMVSYVAVPYQLYQLTGSNFAVGALGIVELVPLLLFGLYGGALADHVDRRRLLVVTGVAQALLTAVLMVNAFLDVPRLWVIYVACAALAAAQSLQRPSKEALEPRTVAHDQITAASALSTLGSQLGLLSGPAIGGILVATVGAAWCFAVDVTGLLVATLLFALMRPYPHEQETTPPSLRGIGEGLAYAVRRRDLLGTYLVDIAAMLMAMPVVLFPALAQDVFERPGLLGLLYTAETIGSMVATATSGWTRHVHHHGRAIVIAATAYGVAIGLAGLAPSIGLAIVLFAVAGAADMVSGLFRATIWNQTIPDTMRGRLAGIEMLSYSARTAGRPGARRAGRRRLVGARLDRQRRCPVRGRGRGHGGCGCATSGPTTPAPTSTPCASGRCARSGAGRADPPRARAARYGGYWPHATRVATMTATDDRLARTRPRRGVRRPPRDALPPGPQWPSLLQSIALVRFRHRFVPAMHRRLRRRLHGAGHAAGVRRWCCSPVPEHAREIFAGDPAVFHAGKGNAILGPVMGEHSLLLHDGSEHQRARRLLMPAFNGAALRGYEALVADLARDEVDGWPPGTSFRSLDRMNALTLEVILRVVFGVTDEDRLARLRPLVRPDRRRQPGRAARLGLPVPAALRPVEGARGQPARPRRGDVRRDRRAPAPPPTSPGAPTCSPGCCVAPTAG